MNKQQAVRKTIQAIALFLLMSLFLCLTGCGANPSKTFRPEGWTEIAPLIWTVDRGAIQIEARPMTRAFMDSALSVDFKIKNTGDSSITLTSITLDMYGDSRTAALFTTRAEGGYLTPNEIMIPRGQSLGVRAYFSALPMSLPGRLSLALTVQKNSDEIMIPISMVDCGEKCKQAAGPEGPVVSTLLEPCSCDTEASQPADSKKTKRKKSRKEH